MARQTKFIPSSEQPLRIGTRGSPLALVQAREVCQALKQAHNLADECFSIQIVHTNGDIFQDQPLASLGGKSLFTKEIEDKLLSKEIDLAVHSAKDVPTRLPKGLEIPIVLPRENVQDAFISAQADRLQDLPMGANVGTISLRRRALVSRLRPDLKLSHFRGNVNTRLNKLSKGIVDATLLATAGLRRLKLSHVITSTLPIEVFPPAIGQGAIVLEVHEEAHAIKMLLDSIHHQPTSLCLTIERAFLDVLDGSCRTPIAGHASFNQNTVTFHGLILSLDGQRSFSVNYQRVIKNLAEAQNFGKEAGHALRQKAGQNFLQELQHSIEDLNH